MTQEIKLPPLPNPAFDDLDDCAMFSSVQMTNYARAAVEADRKQRGEPQAPSSFVNAAGIHASDGYATVIRKLDAAFHAAVTFRDAAPTIKDSLTVAGAAKVPSDDEILAWAGEEQFFLFADAEEVLDIVKSALQHFGHPIPSKSAELKPAAQAQLVVNQSTECAIAAAFRDRFVNSLASLEDCYLSRENIEQAAEDVLHSFAARAALAQQPSEQDREDAAYEAGWRNAALWADRGDLISDIGSAAYEKDRAAARAAKEK